MREELTGLQFYSHLPNAPWPGLTFGTSRVLRVFSAPTSGGVPTSCQAMTATWTGSGAPSYEPRPHTCAAVEATQSPERPGARAPKRLLVGRAD